MQYVVLWKYMHVPSTSSTIVNAAKWNEFVRKILRRTIFECYEYGASKVELEYLRQTYPAWLNKCKFYIYIFFCENYEIYLNIVFKKVSRDIYLSEYGKLVDSLKISKSVISRRVFVRVYAHFVYIPQNNDFLSEFETGWNIKVHI